MKSDYYRYIAEITSNAERIQANENSLQCYKQALDIQKEHLPPTDPVRLGMMLSFSVFYYEIMNQPSLACELARQAFDEAIAKLDDLSEDSKRESTLLLQLLRDNLAMWTSECDNNGEELEDD
eukprot:TRINITY_DN1816_c0_g1_i1.p1 TRINITY_DN1816_c0_g1~~TRINITY_DN1816_c0_g1_i1.p1  ORF type:complete len:136 (+),score=17.40 TRINITY_DN1816_c0_g1_i1:41-409(+)